MLNFIFLTTSLATKSLKFFIYTSKSSTFVFKLFKLIGNLLMSNFSTLDKATKSFLAGKSDVSTPVL